MRTIFSNFAAAAKPSPNAPVQRQQTANGNDNDDNDRHDRRTDWRGGGGGGGGGVPSLAQLLLDIGAVPLDPSPSSTSPIIAQHLTRLDQEIKSAKDRVHATLLKDQKQFEDLWRTGRKLKSRVQANEVELGEIETTLEDPETGLLPTLLSTLSTHSTLTHLHAHSSSHLLHLSHLSTALSSLSTLSSLATTSPLSAIPLLPRCKAALFVEEVGRTEVGRKARRRVGEVEEGVRQRLLDTIRGGLTVVDGGVKVKAEGWVEAVEGLQSLEGAKKDVDRELEKLASLVVHTTLEPLLTSSGSQTLSEHPGGVLHLTPSPSPEPPFASIRLLLTTLRTLHPSTPTRSPHPSFLTSKPPSSPSSSTPPSPFPLPSTPLDTLTTTLDSTRSFTSWAADGGWGHLEGVETWCGGVGEEWGRKMRAEKVGRVREVVVGMMWEGVEVEWAVEVPPPPPPPALEVEVAHAPALQQPTGFRSLFDFAPLTSPTATLSSPTHPTSPPPQKQKPTLTSAELLRSFTPSPPLRSPEAVAVGSPPPPEPVIVETTREEEGEGEDEGVDWDFDAPVETVLPISVPVLAPTTKPKPKPKSAFVPREEEEEEEEAGEDAWGLGGEDEEGEVESKSVGGVGKAGKHAGHEAEVEEPDAWGFGDEQEEGEEVQASLVGGKPPPVVNGTSTPPPPAAHQEEQGDDDPDGWGFDADAEEDEEGEQGVGEGPMRLRGGMASPSGSEDGGWGWQNDDHDHGDERGGQGRKVVERFTISKVAKEVVGVAKEVLRDAAIISDPSFPYPHLRPAAPFLTQTSHDIFTLFRALMPIHHSSLLDSVPSLGMQFANDCEWIGKEVGLLGEGERFKEGEGKMRELAEQTRQKQLDIQSAALMECLDGAEGFRDTAEEPQFVACDRALKQVVHTLERLGQAWRPVMLPSAYYSSLGMLVDTVLRKVLDDIQAQPDIGDKESQQLNVLCKSLHGLEGLFQDGEVATVAQHVPCWFKFSFLSELLEASMADIMWMHNEGVLLEYTPDEIANFIRALFADSALRSKNIDTILSSRR